MTHEAQTETGAVRDMLYEMGGKLLFETPVPIPKCDPIVIQGWSCKGVPVLLSVRQNSGMWSLFGLMAADCNVESLSSARKLIENAQARNEAAKAAKA